MRALLVLALVAGFSSHAWAVDSDGTKPDPKLTPGAVRTGDRAMICGHSTREFRRVTLLEKIAARRAYGILPPRDGWCAEGTGCSVDHLVPLECGGADVPANLWPEKGSGAYNQEDKNRLEGLCKKLICRGTITPAEAQAWFLNDWTQEYIRRFGPISGDK